MALKEFRRPEPSRKPTLIMQKKPSKKLLNYAAVPGMLLAAGLAPVNAGAQDMPAGNAAHGQAYFQISGAVCHSPALGPDNTVIIKQGPSLVGVVGRRAGTLPHFNYTRAMQNSGFTWDAATLNKFLSNPLFVLPGTTMPMPVPDATNRADVIAYLSTLKLPEGVTLKYEVATNASAGRRTCRIILRRTLCRLPSRPDPPATVRKWWPRPRTPRWRCRRGSR